MSPAVSDTLFWLAVALCAVAQLFILKAVFVVIPPAGGPAATGRLRPMSRPFEIAWVIIPALALAFLFYWAWQLRHPPAPAGAPAVPEAVR